jgi:hypothetical protein
MGWVTKQRATAVVVVLVLASAIILKLTQSKGPIESDAEILEAIRRSELGAVQEYLSQGGSPDRRIDVYGRSMSILKAAVLDREQAIALSLMDAGANVQASGVMIQVVGLNGLNRVLDRMLTALPGTATIEHTGVMQTALNGYYDTVEVYVRHSTGSEGEWATEFNRAAGAAMVAGYDDVARLLLQSGANLDEMLHVAARFSSPGMIRYLLARGMDPEEALILPADDYSSERTPIEFAWKRLKEETDFYETASDNPSIEFLRNGDAAYVLFELSRAGAHLEDVDISDVARDGLAEVRALDEEERLIAAARAGYYEVVEGLVVSDGTVGTRETLRDAVLAALENDHDDIARLLLVSGAPPDGGALHIAAAASSPGMVRHLLRLGADPSERYRGRLPLQFWLERNATEDPEFILHELIVSGVDACWLVEFEGDLPGLSRDILEHSAPECWDD